AAVARAALERCRRRSVSRPAQRAPAAAVRRRDGEAKTTLAEHARPGGATSSGLVRLFIRRHGVLLPGWARPALGAGKRGAGVDGNDDSARDSAGLSRVRLPAWGRFLQAAVDADAPDDQRDRHLPLRVENALVARARCGLGIPAGGGAPCVSLRRSSSSRSTPRRTTGTAAVRT